MGKTFSAICLFLDSFKLSRNGFDSEEAAWSYVSENICEHCRKQYDAGGLVSAYRGENGQEVAEWTEIAHIGDTACGAEWTVVLAENSQAFGDLLETRGYMIYNRDPGDENDV
jgi:hypothetical protein